MKALLISGYGPIAGNIALAEIASPTVSPTDVLVDVHAASINPIDFKIVQGALKLVQKLQFPATLGFDVSGVVIAVGNRVSQFKVGDAVYARSDRERLGAFAEQVALDESWVAHKPNTSSFIEAATLPLVGLTTIQALRDRAHAQSGQRVLIHAGSGGVGTFAIQYAKALGLHVTTTTSSRNAELVRSLGADDVVCYDNEDYLKRTDRYDIVFDTLGDKYTLDAFRVVKLGGTVVSIAGPPDGQFADQVGAGILLRAAMRLMSRQVFKAADRAGACYHRFLTESKGPQLTEIASMVDAGKIKPIIDKIFPFAEIVDAMLYTAQGRARGKVVVQMKSSEAKTR
jgi:alcohol dehydrogenase